MLLKLLGVVLLGTLVVAEIPSYMKICGRRNPNLAECVKNSVEGLREKLRSGMPELDVPPLEPLIMKGFPIANTDQLKAFASNVTFTGFSNFEAKDLKIDLEKMELYIEVVFKELILDANYDVKAKILVPIEGRGPIHITTNDIVAAVTMKYKLIKKNGREYMFFPTMTTKLDIRDYKAHFEPENSADRDTLATAINAAIDGGRQEILQSINPSIERVISEEVLELSNKICQHFTYDELFPDRE